MTKKLNLILYITFVYILVIPLYFISFFLKYILTIIDVFFELLLFAKRYKSISEFKEEEGITELNLIKGCIEFINTKEL
jgi:hypothetical protein